LLDVHPVARGFVAVFDPLEGSAEAHTKAGLDVRADGRQWSAEHEHGGNSFP
jgi:hypothetical protein